MPAPLRRLGLLIALGSSLGLAACGNDWASSDARRDSPSARMLDAQMAFDASQYESAVAIYETVLAADARNVEARTRLAFAYNAKAGLDLFEFTGKTLALRKTSKASAGPSAEFARLLGLSASEKDALVAKLGSKSKGRPAGGARLDLSQVSLAELRAASPKLANLHRSFTSACRLLPKRVLDKAIRDARGPGFDPQKALELESACLDGVDESLPVNSAAVLAVTISSLAQASILYQLSADPADSARMAIVLDGERLKTKLDGLRSDIEGLNGNAASSIALERKLGELNLAVAQVTSLSRELSGEVMSGMAVQLNLLEMLLPQNKNVPKELRVKLGEASTKLGEKRLALADSLPNSALAKDPLRDAALRLQQGDASQESSQGVAKRVVDSVDGAFAKQIASLSAAALGAEERAARENALRSRYQALCVTMTELRAALGKPKLPLPVHCVK